MDNSSLGKFIIYIINKISIKFKIVYLINYNDLTCRKIFDIRYCSLKIGTEVITNIINYYIYIQYTQNDSPSITSVYSHHFLFSYVIQLFKI